MKVCPKCKRDYADDGLRYCLDDGSALVAKTEWRSQEAQPTLLMPQQTRQRARPTTVPDTVKLLLKTSVRVSAKNNLGETAEFLARKKNHYDIATLMGRD